MEQPRVGTVHIIFHPVSARRFVEPLVQALIADGKQAELWVQSVPGTELFQRGFKVPTQICPSNLGFNVLAVLPTLCVLVRRLWRRRPHVVHAHLFRGALLPLLAAALCRVPVRIYHNHGVVYVAYTGILGQLLKFIEWANCHLATHIVTVSPGMRPFLQAVAPRRPIHIFGPGSACGLEDAAYAQGLEPQTRIAARAKRGFKPGDLVLMYVGRPHVRKGFDIMLEAFRRLFAGRPDVYLLVCGCTPADTAKFQLYPVQNIRALGYVEDLRPLYEASDAVLLPSLFEGFGNCLLEGAALGTALLASRVPGPDVLVCENENGFLVKPGDLEDLTLAMRRMDEDRAGLLAMGAEAYVRAMDFRREFIITPYLAFMRDILAADLRFCARAADGKLAA